MPHGYYNIIMIYMKHFYNWFFESVSEAYVTECIIAQYIIHSTSVEHSLYSGGSGKRNHEPIRPHKLSALRRGGPSDHSNYLLSDEVDHQTAQTICSQTRWSIRQLKLSALRRGGPSDSSNYLLSDEVDHQTICSQTRWTIKLSALRRGGPSDSSNHQTTQTIRRGGPSDSSNYLLSDEVDHQTAQTICSQTRWTMATT